MKVEHIVIEGSGSFTAILDGREAGKMTYFETGENRISIDHTEVVAAYKGKGVGKELLETAAEYARDNNYKIIPLCSYAKTLMERSSAYDDVLH